MGFNQMNNPNKDGLSLKELRNERRKDIPIR